ncbi:CHAT domain-containing protein [Scytonema sp. UIC 10036]|uniref:CHAT domain-containing protein n=1 Tax=Scytonema sp. UIC 10036 TaxID=2304196 RepID=UPI0012DA8654|nr:CHAT domain-containing protein [Scytonema sp. UIC 10036]MUG94180.1 CHAT domain-containing protein [Scytonema sp. UIC 10036]
MNEERIEAYLNLIQKILSCSKGEEDQILNANLKLVDIGLVQTMAQVAEGLAKSEDQEAADFLIHIARDIAEHLELSNFLLQVLQAIDESQGDPQVEYHLLQANLEKLNDNFARLLQNWATKTLSQVEPEQGEKIAVVIGEFSTFIQVFSEGDREVNVEIAITGYQSIARIFTREAFPNRWAQLQQNLGVAYFNRIRGNKEENLEIAINFFRSALEVYTRQAFAKEWADIQNNLGAAYLRRICGDKEENIEMAIWYFKAALEVRTYQEFPREWAETQENLGEAYYARIKEARANNLEAAIRCFEKTLAIYTLQASPKDWANIQIRLGTAYFYRIKGDRTENPEIAIRHFKAALNVYIQPVFSREWADVQIALGVVYSDRIRGERAENLESAIQFYLAALGVYSQQIFPENWAMVQNHLGLAYLNRIQGEKSQNLALAIDYFKQALEVYTQQTFPKEWAMVQNHLGLTYLSLGLAYFDYSVSERSEKLEKALDCLNHALKVYIYQDFPQEWARIQNNLGEVYRNRIKEAKAENLKKAIDCYIASLDFYTQQGFLRQKAETQNNLGLVYSELINVIGPENLKEAVRFFLAALEVRTRQAYPSDYAATQFNMGIAYQNTLQFSQAYAAFAAAIDTIEVQQAEIASSYSKAEDKQKLAEEWNELYQRMVEVCLALDNPAKTLTYVERSKTRNLVELILTKDRYTIFPPEVVAQLDRLRDEIASGQYQLQNATAEDPTALAQHLQQLRQQRNELQNRYLAIGSGFQFKQFQPILSDRTAIVEFYITSDKLLVFIVTKQTQQPIVLPPDLINLKKLANWANSYQKAYSNKKSHWSHRLTTRLHLLAKILHFEEIIKQIPTACDKLILIPHRYLHLLPLHALPLAEDSNLFDRFLEGVSYAPSCQLLQLAQTRQRPEFTHLFAVQNPTGDLTYTDIEVETIQSYFNTSHLLKQKIATREAVDNTYLTAAHCAHFSCHGYFNATQPRKSALILANAQLNSAPTQFDTGNYLSLEKGGILDLNKCLTLDSIFTLNLEQCRLVTLSACETGLIDFRNTSDEYIGLPSGFLYAGASSVVSSLWTVNDLSTAFLMIRLYQNLQKGFAVALALNQAQLWLKDLTKGDLETWIEKNQLPLKPAVRINLRRRFYEFEDDAKLFQSPFYWAAFCALGQ